VNDCQRAEELLAQAWQRPPAYELERLEMLLSALVHAVLASSDAAFACRVRVEASDEQFTRPVRPQIASRTKLRSSN
jgi:hypothetical protein